MASNKANSNAESSEIQPNRKREDFLFLSELAEGSYSTVHLASERETSRRFAVKICLKKKILREKKVEQVFRERDILRLLSTPEHSHPFIVRLYATFQDRDSLYFVLTLAEKHDLRVLLRKFGKFTLEMCQFVMAECWSALSHIHSLHVVHRDVKPENIMLQRSGHILLIDFGCAKKLDIHNPTEKEKPKDEAANEEQTTTTAEEKEKRKRRCSFVGTAQYVSPEILNGQPQPVTAACDWWAFGVILFELLTGKRPFSDESEYLLYKRILRLDYAFPDDFTSEEARQLITQLLVICPEERLGSTEKGGALRIREEPFFAGMDWTNLAQQKSPLFPTEDEPSGPKGRDEEDNN